jgi:hypothetical protein
MKTAKLVVAVILLALACTTTANATPAADAAFLNLLAQGAQQQTQKDSLAGLGLPAPTYMSCSISRDCGDGNTVACTGNYSCANSTKGVTCDSTEYACPNYCTMGWTCTDCPDYFFSCSSLRGDCGVTGEGCNGAPQRCFCPDVIHPVGDGGDDGGDGSCVPGKYGSCPYYSGGCPAYCTCCY